MESELFILTEHDQKVTNEQILTILNDFKNDMKQEFTSFKTDIRQEINTFKEELTDLKGDMSDLKVEMAKTTTLIRDYNGLRSKIDECEKKITTLETSKSTEKETKKDTRDYVGWIIGIIMFAIAMIDKF